ncbi:MAG: ATP-binding protein [Bacillota bacterium]
MRRGLRLKFSLSFLALVLGTTVTIALVLSFTLHRSQLRLLIDSLQAQASLAAVSIREAVDNGAGPEELGALIKALGADTTTRLTLIAVDGTVLGDSWEDPRAMDNHAARPEVSEALAGRIGISSRHSVTTGQTMLYVAKPVAIGTGGPVAIRAARTKDWVDRSLASLWRLLAGAAFLGTLVAGMAGLAQAVRLARPLEDMTGAATAMAGGDYSVRVPALDADELGDLGRSINTLAQSLGGKHTELTEARLILEAVLENMTAGVLLVDRQGRVLLANRAARDILGLPSALGSKGHWEVIRDAALSQAVDRLLAGGTGEQLSVTLARPGGRSLDTRLARIGGEGRVAGAVVVVFHDVTQARRLEQWRRDLVADVSHELKTPVTAIKGYAETLLAGAAEDGTVARDFLETMDAEAARLVKLVDDLLELAALEARAHAVELEPVDLLQAAGEAAERWRLRAVAGGLGLSVAGEAVTVLADRRLLDRALGNLLDNALKCTPAGGRVDVSVWTDAAGGRLAVVDTGPGIPPDMLERVFVRFTRLDPARSRRTGGVGLGLAIVKHSVEAMGGRVWAASGEGRGATFHVVLRLA